MLSNALSGYQTLNMVFKTYQSKGSQREKNSEFCFRTCQSVKTILIIPSRDWFHVQAHMYVIPRSLYGHLLPNRYQESKYL